MISLRKLESQKGQTLPYTLLLVAVLTSTVAIVGYSIVNERKFLYEDNKRSDATLAAESAQHYAKAFINNYLSVKLNGYINDTLGMSTTNLDQCLLGDNLEKRNGLFNGYGTSFTGLGVKTPQQVFMKNLKINDASTSSSLNTKNNSIRNGIKFTAYFFDDKDEDGFKDEGEEGIKWLRFETDNQSKTQSNFYSYAITTYAEFPAGNTVVKRKSVSRGVLNFTIGNDTFAKYSLFTNTHLTESNGVLWFTEKTNFKGPVHTNGQGGSAFNFSGNPGSTFAGKVTSASEKVRWYNGGSDFLQTLGKTKTDNPKNGTKDVPSFANGLTTGVDVIALPENSLSQEKAAMGGDPSDKSTLTKTQIANLIGPPATSTSTPNGIYLPNTRTTSPATTGGIYINGDLDSLTMDVDSNNNQRYYLVQGSTRKYITIDRANNKTIMVDANSSGTPINTTKKEFTGTLKGSIHVSGQIKSLGGPARTSSSNPNSAGPAIASDNALTISATGDIIVQRDIKYQTDPRGADGVFDTADDNLDAKNLLGLFTSGGDVRLGTSLPNNPTLHATVMASASGGVFKVDNYNKNSGRGTVNMLGGVITDKYGAFGTFNSTNLNASGFNRNFEYDIRMEKKRMSPPFFPTMTAFELQGVPNFGIDDWNEGVAH